MIAEIGQARLPLRPRLCGRWSSLRSRVTYSCIGLSFQIDVHRIVDRSFQFLSLPRHGFRHNPTSTGGSALSSGRKWIRQGELRLCGCEESACDQILDRWNMYLIKDGAEWESEGKKLIDIGISGFDVPGIYAVAVRPNARPPFTFWN